MTLVFADPGPGTLGRVDYAHQLITLHPDLLQTERRSTLTHELIHLERGPAAPGCEAREELCVDREAALRLVELADLVTAAQWTDDVHELAFELWVDPDTVRVRLRHLTGREHAVLARVRASRDGESSDDGGDAVEVETWA
ncbi:hypothetical protein [Nocardioides jensenii]|uniref:hypothetical protein n=1 Tax=Nocardioides jensenii TaxID=1843 RepID=UPI001C3F4961|nr:hypothetical protein [Nocardioides jensenii]